MKTSLCRMSAARTFHHLAEGLKRVAHTRMHSPVKLLPANCHLTPHLPFRQKLSLEGGVHECCAGGRHVQSHSAGHIL